MRKGSGRCAMRRRTATGEMAGGALQQVGSCAVAVCAVRRLRQGGENSSNASRGVPIRRQALRSMRIPVWREIRQEKNMEAGVRYGSAGARVLFTHNHTEG